MNRSTVVVILRGELLAWRNRISKRNPARLVLLVVFGVVAAVVFGGSLFAVAVAAGELLPSARDAILGGAFTALAVLMLVVGFPTVIATYFGGRDLMQLILAPITSPQIFLARSLFAMSANVLVALIFLTFVAGLGAGSGASGVYYVLAPVLVFVQVLIVTALQATLMAAVLRWVPARVARDVTVVVASATGAGLYLAWNLTIRQSFGPRRRPDVSSVVSVFHRLEWVPSAWPGHALSAVIDGHAGAAFGWTALILLLAAALVVAASLLYERTLLAGLGLLGGTSAPTRRRAGQRAGATRAGRGSPARAIARKDWLAYRRDIRRLGRFLPAVIFLIAYAVVLVRPARGGDIFWNDVFIIAFVSLFMSMTLAAPSIPAERRGFQLLRLAPITSWQLIRAKVLFTLGPALLFSTLLAVAISLGGGNGFWNTLQIAALAIWLGAGCVCIGVAAGAIDPHFESTDDRRAIGVLGTFTAMGGELAFGLLTVGAFALFRLAGGLAAGTASVGFLPARPEVAALLGAVAFVLAAAGVALVILMLSFANVRLRGFEGSIATT